MFLKIPTAIGYACTFIQSTSDPSTFLPIPSPCQHHPPPPFPSLPIIPSFLSLSSRGVFRGVGKWGRTYS